MRTSVPLLACVMALCSCSTPPRPPTVDESNKRPVNAASAIELQVCKSDLQNTRILVSETTRLAESASATATRLALHQQTMTSQQASASDGNTIYTVRFAFGSTQVAVPSVDASALIERARSAALIVLRGRTDGEVELPSESRIARERANAVRAYLVQAGVDASHIRTTWQPIGDSVAGNGTATGRSQNRRVEIELYRQAPQALSLAVAAPAP